MTASPFGTLLRKAPASLTQDSTVFLRAGLLLSMITSHAQFAGGMLSKLVHATGTDFAAVPLPNVADATVMDGVSTSLTVTSIFLAPA
jgi:hypothetical protein